MHENISLLDLFTNFTLQNKYFKDKTTKLFDYPTKNLTFTPCFAQKILFGITLNVKHIIFPSTKYSQKSSVLYHNAATK